jgi:hypothetical protein
MTFYDIRNNAYQISIVGIGEPFDISDLTIEYSRCVFPDVLYLPKLSIEIVDDSRNILSQLGVVTYNSHPITVSGPGIAFDGYLSSEIFTAPNTGYKERVTLNAISRLESLKNDIYTPSTSENLIAIQSLLSVILSDFSVTYNVLGGYMNLYSTDGCWRDEDYVYFNKLDILEHILRSCCSRLKLNLDGSVRIESYAILAGAVPSSDYSTVKHRGIDETIERGSYFDGAVVHCREFPNSLPQINFKTSETVATNKPIDIRQGKEYWFSQKGNWYHYDRYIGTYGRDSSPGWSFPHYTLTGNVITNWWDSSLLFSSNEPVIGAFPISYRTYLKDRPELAVGLTNAMLVKVSTSTNTMPVAIPPFAICSQKTLTAKTDYLFFTGELGIVSFVQPDANNWYDDDSWNVGYNSSSATWHYCYVPVNPNHATTSYSSSVFGLVCTVKFRGKYWHDATKTWSDDLSSFNLNTERSYHEGEFVRLKDAPPPNNVPLYDGQGYWISFEDNYGSGTIEIVIRARAAMISQGTSGSCTNFVIKDLTIAVASSEGAGIAFDYPKNSIYSVNEGGRYQHSSVDCFLTSSSEIGGGLTQLYHDAAGQMEVDRLNYALPLLSSGNYFTTEKPEVHILRMILQYFSDIKIISDVIDASDYSDRYVYNGDFLWECGMTCRPLKCDYIVDLAFNSTNYGVL